MKVKNKSNRIIYFLLYCLTICLMFFGISMNAYAARGEDSPFPDEYEEEAEEANLPILYADSFNKSLAENPTVTVADCSTMKFNCVIPGICETDDGKMYLYQMQVYEYSIPDGAEPVAVIDVCHKPEFSYALNHKQSDTRLYSKFVLCVKSNGNLVPLCEPQFVSNPERLAADTRTRRNFSFKSTQQESFTNLMLNSSHSQSASGCLRVVQIMNNGSDQSMTNPYARSGVSDPHPISVRNYYMLNANDADGVARLISAVEYYAKNATRTDDWIIGNEVNVRTWNYMAIDSWDEYFRQYEQVFRICYIAIKSNNANAHVSLSLDQNWNQDFAQGSSSYYLIYDSKDFLTKFAEDMRTNGDIDWGFAFHPYTAPLTYVKFWDMSGCRNGSTYAGWVAQDKVVTFQNLGVISEFMEQDNMRSPSGDVRHFTLTEVAMTNAQGDDVQAAAVVACYVAAKRNPYAEYILYCNVNHGEFDATLGPRAADAYRNMDGSDSARVQNWALGYIGISDWSAVLR